MTKKGTSIFLIISLLCFLCVLSVNATETDIVYESDYGLVDLSYRPNIPEKSDDVENGALNLPNTYYPRSTNAVTYVKAQENNGTYWSFGTIGILESKNLINYLESGMVKGISLFYL